jgi:hypothetical protein
MTERAAPAPAKASRSRTTIKQNALTESDIREFTQGMAAIAALLRNFDTPLQLANGKNHDRTEEAYSILWRNAKDKVEPQFQEQAKATLRGQGCSELFIEVIDAVIQSKLSTDVDSKKQLLSRFMIALRLAVHLSPDRGAQLISLLDEQLQPQNCPQDSAALTISTTYARAKKHPTIKHLYRDRPSRGRSEPS